MIRWFFNLLYGSRPIEFESSFDMAESIRRLQDATGRTIFSAVSRPRAVGKVTERRVVLSRVVPMVGNSFKPCFVGRFEQRDGRVVLTGWFRTSYLFRVTSAFLFLIIPAATIATFFKISPQQPQTWLNALGFLAFSIFLVVIQLVGRSATFYHKEWLSDVIRTALRETSTNSRSRFPLPCPPPVNRRNGAFTRSRAGSPRKSG